MRYRWCACVGHCEQPCDYLANDTPEKIERLWFATWKKCVEGVNNSWGQFERMTGRDIEAIIYQVVVE